MNNESYYFLHALIYWVGEVHCNSMHTDVKCQLQELVLTLYPGKSLGQIQVNKIACKCPYPMSHCCNLRKQHSRKRHSGTGFKHKGSSAGFWPLNSAFNFKVNSIINFPKMLKMNCMQHSEIIQLS